MTIQTKIQYEALAAYKNVGCQASVCLATGFGKTRVGVLAIQDVLKEKPEANILIVVPTTHLRDNQWIPEIRKWASEISEETLEAQVRVECIQTAYKWNSLWFNNYDLIIFDELHRMLSPEYGMIHDKLDSSIKKLGLTATPPKHDNEKMQKLVDKLPIVYQKTLDEGVELGILAPFKVFNIGVKLPHKELWKYNLFNGKFNKARYEIYKYVQLLKSLRTPLESDNVFKVAEKFRQSKYGKHYPELMQHSKDFWNYMSMRKWVCYNNPSKINTAKELIKMFPNRTWILFTKSVKFCEKTTAEINKDKDLSALGYKAISYHSKYDKEKRAAILDSFKREKYNIIVSIEALSEGYNVPRLDAAISLASVSTEINNTQQMGRILRLQEDKEAMFFNLYSIDTKEEDWVKTKTWSIPDVKWIKSTDNLNTKINVSYENSITTSPSSKIHSE